MQTKIEAKFLGTNHDSLRTRLDELGAVCQRPVTVTTRVNMDYADRRLKKQGSWVRVCNNGNKVTLTYKQLDSWTLSGVKEIEIVVSDFAQTQALLEAVGLQVCSRQTTKRETWTYKGSEVVLDEWPWVEPFIEIEGPSEAAVNDIAKDLGLDWENAVFGSVEPVYMAEYDITEEQFLEIDSITFDQQPPAWLLKAKRKT